MTFGYGTHKILMARMIFVQCLPLGDLLLDVSEDDLPSVLPSLPSEKWKKDEDVDEKASFDS